MSLNQLLEKVEKTMILNVNVLEKVEPKSKFIDSNVHWFFKDIHNRINNISIKFVIYFYSNLACGICLGHYKDDIFIDCGFCMYLHDTIIGWFSVRDLLVSLI